MFYVRWWTIWISVNHFDKRSTLTNNHFHSIVAIIEFITGLVPDVSLLERFITRIYQVLSGSICTLDCHGWPSAGEKSLKLINTPSHSLNDGQASPCLNSHSTHIPILIACSILCLVLPHHCPIHVPQSIDFRSLLLFLQAWVHAFPWAFRYSPDEINQNSSLKTFTHNLTLSSLQKLPLNIPIISIVSKFHPNLSYLINIPLETTIQSSGGIVDDMAIHSLHTSLFTDLNTI